MVGVFREFLSASGMNRRTFETEEICATGGDVVHNTILDGLCRARGRATNAVNPPRYPSPSDDFTSPRAQVYTFLVF